VPEFGKSLAQDFGRSSAHPWDIGCPWGKTQNIKDINNNDNKNNPWMMQQLGI
jgi:hypothetical protein